MRILYVFVILCSFLSVAHPVQAQSGAEGGDSSIAIRMDGRCDGEITG